MAEEQQVDEVKVVDTIEETQSKTMESKPEAGEDTPSEKSGLSGLTNPVVFLLFMIFAMILVIAVISVRSGRDSSPSDSSDSSDPTIAVLKADLEARRMELNRQRLALNLPPIEGSSEPVDDIADRLKRDAETLVGLAESFRLMLAEKDSEVSSRNSEILRLEKLRQDVSLENSRLQSELNRALSDGSEAARLRSTLSSIQAERDALSLEVSEAKTQLAELTNTVSGGDFADLSRRFDETQRERDFYQDRVKELESELEK
jgi:chromosome segregation ATPase